MDTCDGVVVRAGSRRSHRLADGPSLHPNPGGAGGFPPSRAWPSRLARMDVAAWRLGGPTARYGTGAQLRAPNWQHPAATSGQCRQANTLIEAELCLPGAQPKGDDRRTAQAPTSTLPCRAATLDLRTALGAVRRAPAPAVRHSPAGMPSPAYPGPGHLREAHPGAGVRLRLTSGSPTFCSERTHAWSNAFGKLRWCTERRRRMVEFWVALAHAIIIACRLIRRAWTCSSCGPLAVDASIGQVRPYRRLRRRFG